MFGHSLDNVKKAIAAIFGFTLLLIGIALLVLPGPGLLVILIGLIILAGEFIWAKKALARFRAESGKIKKRFMG